MSTPSISVALFLDPENFHGVIYDAIHGNGSYRTARGTQELLFSPGKLARMIESRIGRVVSQHAYGDWSRLKVYYDDLIKHRITPVFVPARGVGKNSADIRLVCDALVLAHRQPDITHFVIASCDSDFSSLALVLREMGKKVIGVAVQGARVGSLWRSACDVFCLLPVPVKTPAPAAKPAAPRKTAAKRGNRLPAAPLANGTKSHPKVAVMPARAEEYQRLLEARKIRLFSPGVRVQVFAALAEMFRDPNASLAAKRGPTALRKLLKPRLTGWNLGLDDEDIRALSLMLWDAHLMRHDGSRFQLQTEPDVAAMDRGLARGLMQRILWKCDPFDVPAVRFLLHGADAPLDDGLEQIAAEAEEALRHRFPALTVPAPAPCLVGS